MPVLKSLKTPVMFGEEPLAYRTGIQPVGIITTWIIHEILSETPRLLIGACQDFQSTMALKREIIRKLDRKNYPANLPREELIDRIFHSMFGYGELQPFVEEEDISDIDGTRYDQFSIVRKGKREKANINMGDGKQFETYCRLIATRNGGILNENDSHCRVTDPLNRLRINISIPPRNISGPAVSIRKHRKNSYTYCQLEELGMLDSLSRELLQGFSRDGKTLLFCGKGAAGKTTLLRAFVNSLEEMERVLVVESDAEIYPDKPFCMEQRVKKFNEGGSPVTLDMLLKDGLTMSLDTYCVGEIVSEEAYEFMKASCSGHRMLGTVHANNAAECIIRMVSLASGAAGSEKPDTLFEMFSNGVDAIVFLRDFQVVEILGITGHDKNSGRPECCYLYRRS